MDIKRMVKNAIKAVVGDTRWRLRIVERKVDNLQVLTDIRKVPKATGPSRMIQLSALALLKDITDAISAAGIQYSICGGTLLGAVRHKGFIPWDDDVDMAVLRKDYDRVYELLCSRYNEQNGFRVVRSNCIRVIMEDAPCQVDIFPFEICRIPKDDSEGLENFSCLRDRYIKERVRIDWSRLYSDQNVLTNLDAKGVEHLSDDFHKEDAGECKVLVTGCEAGNKGYPPLKYDWVFPLGALEFEGMRFSAPADPEVVVFNYFGDWTKYPQLMRPHGDIRQRLTIDSYIRMRDFVRSHQLMPEE